MEEGRYKDNVIVAACTRKSRPILGSLLGSTKLRDRVDNAVAAAQRAAQIAHQKAEIAQTRMAAARAKAALADAAAEHARADAILARTKAKNYAPELELTGR